MEKMTKQEKKEKKKEEERKEKGHRGKKGEEVLDALLALVEERDHDRTSAAAAFTTATLRPRQTSSYECYHQISIYQGENGQGQRGREGGREGGRRERGREGEGNGKGTNFHKHVSQSQIPQISLYDKVIQ